MTYKYSLGVGNTGVKEKMATPQFELSEKLLDKRYELNLTIEQLAQITQETSENYLKMEYASSDIPVERYNEALKIIASL